MQQTIDIPTPSSADTETVITALETAALFRSKGDGQEAMRWLRRAAESAGEAGDDERALSLSRVVADLHDELDAMSGVREATPSAAPQPTVGSAALPSAPLPLPPSPRPAPPPPSSSPRASHPPPPSSRGVRPSSVPRASYAPRPSSRPSYGAAASSRLPPASAAITASTPQPARAEAGRSGARHAARVAIEISTTKPGVFELRLLADGEAPRIGSSEALLVMLDPESQLLSR